MKSPESLAGAAPPAALHQVSTTWSPYSRASAAWRTRLRRWWSWCGFNHDVASKVRYELDMLLLRLRCRLSSSYRRDVARLSSQSGLLVHLGCGNALLPGWLNLDCYPPPRTPGLDMLTLDLRRGLPLADASAEALFSEHFLEHLPVETVREVILPEIRRVLAPGGRVRIGIPDGEYFVDQYIASRSGGCDPLYEANRHGKTPMTMLNEIAAGFGHYFAYDFQTFSAMLCAAGFVNVRRCRPFDSTVDSFKGKDRVDPWRNAMTLYVEAEAA